MKKGKSNARFSSERRRGKASLAHVTINLTAGPASPARKQAWRKFWAKLITEDKHAAAEGDTSSTSSDGPE